MRSSKGASPSSFGVNHSAAWRTASSAFRSDMDARGSAICLPCVDELSVLELQLIQAMVDAAMREQFLMRSGLAQLALVEDEYAVHVLDRRQPVCNRDCRAPPHHDTHRVTDQQLGFRIDARRRLVEHEHRRIEGERTRK